MGSMESALSLYKERPQHGWYVTLIYVGANPTVDGGHSRKRWSFVYEPAGQSYVSFGALGAKQTKQYVEVEVGIKRAKAKLKKGYEFHGTSSSSMLVPLNLEQDICGAVYAPVTMDGACALIQRLQMREADFGLDFQEIFDFKLHEGIPLMDVKTYLDNRDRIWILRSWKRIDHKTGAVERGGYDIAVLRKTIK